VTGERRHDAIALAILALVPTLLFLDVLLGINNFYVRDIVHYYYPAKKVLRDIVIGGEFPYWNPFFSAGQPLAANPEHEVFYPLTWLILLPGYNYAYHLLSLVHLYIAGFSTYALLRSMRVRRAAAVFGGLSFSIGGLALSTLCLLPYLFSMSWLPLTCLYTRHFLLRGGRRDLALAALFLGMQLLVGEPTTALQTGLLLGLYALWRAPRVKRVAAVGAISLAALLLSAIQTLPTLDHYGDSVRSRGFDFSVVSTWSFPLARVAEAVYPDAVGHFTPDGSVPYWAAGLYGGGRGPFFFSIYSGLAVAALAAGGVLARMRAAGLYLAILAVSIVAAAGANTPLLRLLYDLHLADSLRYAEKFAIIGVFATVIFGSLALDRLLAGDERIRRTTLLFLGVTTAIAALLVGLSWTPACEWLFRGVWSLQRMPRIAEMLAISRTDWLLAAARGVLLLLLVRNVATVRRPAWLAMLGVFVLLDLGSRSAELAPRMPSSFLTDVPPATRQFPAERGAFRLMDLAHWQNGTPAARRYHVPGPDAYWISRNAMNPMLPAAHGLRTVLEIDFDLTSLLPTEDFTRSMWEVSPARKDWLSIAASMSNAWYLGVLKPPEQAFAEAHGVMRDVQAVRYIEGPHWPRYYFATQVVSIRDPHDFVRKLSTERFEQRVAFIGEPAFAPARGAVQAVTESANAARIAVEAAGRAFLVLSVTPHKYWRITIDGVEVPAIVTNIGYQGVVVPAGRHVVEMRYRNPLVAAGGAVSLATLLALGLAMTRRKEAAAEASEAVSEAA